MLRPEIGTDTLAYVELALNKLRASKTAVERIDAQRTVGDYLLTFWGALEDGDSATEVKAFVMAGKYLERLDLFSRFRAGRGRLQVSGGAPRLLSQRVA